MIASATESVYGRRQPARRPARRGHGLAGPTVQIETNLVLLLPALIEQNKLLSFISRRNIERGTRVKEVPFGETTMKRRFAVSYRSDTYLSPAAQRFVDLLQARSQALFREE